MKSSFLLGLLVFGACGNTTSGDEAYFAEIADMEAPHPKSGDLSFDADGAMEYTATIRQVIKTGNISFQSKDVVADDTKLKQLVKHFKAQIEHENQTREYGQLAYTFTVRVPSSQYDSLLNAIAKLAWRLDNKSSNAEDVTEQYYDLETRIKNKKALEARYVELLKQTKTMRDILEIEQSLNNVRTEIESMEGRFRFLKSQISMSTVHVRMYEELPEATYDQPRKSFGSRLFSGLTKGWRGFLHFVVFAVSLWPFWIILTVVIVGVRKWQKARKN